MSNVTTEQWAIPQQKNPNTGDRVGWGHRFLEIKKGQGVFMKNSWNFHWWSWFPLSINFHQQGVSHNFAEFAGMKACFLEVPKVTYLKISVFLRKVYTGVKTKENLLTRHQFTNLLKSVIPLRHDVFGVLAF